MKLRYRIILVYGIIALLLIVIGTWAAFSSSRFGGSASSNLTTEEASSALKVTFGDDTDTVIYGQKVIFKINLENTSDLTIPGIKVVGAVGMDQPTKEADFFDNLAKDVSNDSNQNGGQAVDYNIGDLGPKAKTNYEIPFVVTKKTPPQTAMYSQIAIYALVKGQSSGAIIDLKPNVTLTSIAKYEDVNKVIDLPKIKDIQYKCRNSWADCEPVQ